MKCGTEFYHPSDNGYEKQIKEYMRFLKENIPSARLRLELCPSNQRACDVYMRHGFKVLDYKQMIYDKI